MVVSFPLNLNAKRPKSTTIKATHSNSNSCFVSERTSLFFMVLFHVGRNAVRGFLGSLLFGRTQVWSSLRWRDWKASAARDTLDHRIPWFLWSFATQSATLFDTLAVLLFFTLDVTTLFSIAMIFATTLLVFLFFISPVTTTFSLYID